MNAERLTTVQMLKKLEGFSGVPYRDSEGKVTIGYGHNLEASGGISEKAAEAQLLLDVQKAEADVIRSLRSLYDELDPVRREALVQMAFQMGIGLRSRRTGLLGFEAMLAAMEKRDFVTAANEALDSKWQRQDPTRSAIVARMILTGQWPDGSQPEERKRLGSGWRYA